MRVQTVVMMAFGAITAAYLVEEMLWWGLAFLAFYISLCGLCLTSRSLKVLRLLWVIPSVVVGVAWVFVWLYAALVGMFLLERTSTCGVLHSCDEVSLILVFFVAPPIIAIEHLNAVIYAGVHPFHTHTRRGLLSCSSLFLGVSFALASILFLAAGDIDVFGIKRATWGYSLISMACCLAALQGYLRYSRFTWSFCTISLASFVLLFSYVAWQTFRWYGSARTFDALVCIQALLILAVLLDRFLAGPRKPQEKKGAPR